MPNPLHINLPIWPVAWTFEWYGHSPESGAARAKVAADLEQQPEKALVIVRYSPNHQPSDEWVYNAADIDSSKVVWAREMDEAENLELMHYYKDRKVWLVQPDSIRRTFLSIPQQHSRRSLSADETIES